MVIRLPLGLLGFENVKQYALLANPAEEPFMWFQLLDDSKRAFLVAPPSRLVADYQPDINDDDVEFLEIKEPADAFLLNIITIQNGKPSTINLKGPLVINRHTLIGKQVIPNNASHVLAALSSGNLLKDRTGIMLILSRKIGESIVIDGRIVVKIVRLDGEVVKLGIQAAKDVPVHRQEVYEEIQRNNMEALTANPPPLEHTQVRTIPPSKSNPAAVRATS